jgi:nucleoside 2-deoxyribosyltransferase
MEDVWMGICEAGLIVADLSSANPNVAYEVGLADVLGKKVILLAQDVKEVPAHLKSDRLLMYSPNSINKLQDILVGRITDAFSPSARPSRSAFFLGKDGTLQVIPKYPGRHATSKSHCWVIVPPNRTWEANVKHTVRLAVKETSLKPRIPEENIGSVKMDDVWKELCESSVVIADLTDADPNITYEIGLADALGKEVILLVQNKKKVPFDFDSKRLIVYNPDNLQLLHEKLSDRLSRIPYST